MLIQFLVAAGNLVGRSAHMMVGATTHYPNLYAGLVGQSSKARKRSGWRMVRDPLHAVAPVWCDDQIRTGLSSGEGALWAVRDRTSEDDEGVDDKRMLVVEEELAQVLKVAARPDNTLTTRLRSLYDDGRGQVLTRGQPLKATGVHLSIIGHVTLDELRTLLASVDVVNGFANRFLWAVVSRSKFLPDGGQCMTSTKARPCANSDG